MNTRNIFTIAKKELLSYINSGTGYILIVPFLLITFFIFFRQAFVTSQASLRPFFDLLPYVLLFLAPAIAMRTFAQEQRNKTLEVIFAHPVTEVEIVLGKFFGALGFFALMLLSTITLPITTILFAKPDIGVIISQYLGALFVGGAFLAIGIAASALVASQVASFLCAVAVSFILILVGTDMVLLSFPSLIGAFISQLAILPHMSNISRGALDLRDLLYFITLISTALTVAVIKLSARKIAESQSARQKLYIALGLVVVFGVVTNVLMYSYPIRLDLTVNRLFTLSKGTRQTIGQLPDVVNITFYTSTNLPGTVEATVRQTKDILRDYQRLGKGRVRLIEKHPDLNPEDKSSATTDGIQEVQFNTLSNNAFAVQTGYVGLALQYLDKKETIAFVQNSGELEYQLTRLIRKMTTKTLPEITLYSQPNISYSGQPVAINALRDTLKEQYAVKEISLDQPEASIAGKAVVVYGLTQPMSATASAKIKSFVKGGGNAVLLFDNHTVNPQLGTAPSYALGVEDMLSADYGLAVNQDLVYDLRLNEIITLQAGNQQYLMPYPFWIKSLPSKAKSIPLQSIGSVSLAWPNSFGIAPKEGVTVEKLLVTSKSSGAQTGTFQIAPEKLTPEDFKVDSEEKTLALLANNGTGKIVLVGDSDFITDQFVQNAPQNLSFALALIDYTAADEALATVVQKTGDSPVFTFDSADQAQVVQYINLLAVPVAVALFGGWWMWRRKMLYRRVYSN